MEQEKDAPEAVQENQMDSDMVQENKDTISEATASDADPADVQQEIEPEKLHLMLEDARAKADEHWEQLIRVRAETENLKKRHARELENAHKYAIDKFVSELLPVKDSMELGLDAGTGESADLNKIIEGTQLTLKLFSDVMGKFGIQEVNPLGEPFDPEYHQAMAMQPSDEHEPNTVITVVQKGYTLNDRLVRPAMVMVSQAT